MTPLRKGKLHITTVTIIWYV